MKNQGGNPYGLDYLTNIEQPEEPMPAAPTPQGVDPQQPNWLENIFGSSNADKMDDHEYDNRMENWGTFMGGLNGPGGDFYGGYERLTPRKDDDEETRSRQIQQYQMLESLLGGLFNSGGGESSRRYVMPQV